MDTTATATITHLGGRRTLHLPSPAYIEQWASRYQRAQAAIERDRLRKGLAKHRAHRLVLKSAPTQDAA